jgi:MFS family permease
MSPNVARLSTPIAENDNATGNPVENPQSASPADAPATEASTETPAPIPAAPPAMEPMSAFRGAGYMVAAVVLSLAQGLGMNFISANLLQIQGSLGATTNEATWLMAAYMAPNVSLSLALIKIRTQYGLRNFAEISIVVFVAVSLMHLLVNDYHSALVLRFFAGVAAAPMSSLAFLYMLQPFPPAKKMNIGLCVALANMSIAAPVARLISAPLLDLGGWHSLYLMEIAVAMMALGAVYLLPLTPVPRAKVISFADIVSYLLIAVGFGCLAIVLTVGRLYWWTEAPWIGMLLAGSIVSLISAAIIELNRDAPLIDIRWLTSKEVLHFMGVLIIFRIALSEQSSGAYGLFQTLGLSPDQTRVMWAAILVSSVVSGLICSTLMKPGREPFIHAAALIMIGVGAYMDSQSTNVTRPEQMIVSQMLIAVGGALFLPPALAAGLMSALKNGPNYILSFVIVFLTTQSLGGLFGSALLGSFLTIREKFHSSYLVEHISLTDPIVAQRVSQLSGAYGKVLTDKALLNAEGLQMLSQQATREANVLAYNDLFLLVAGLCAAALAGLLIHMFIKAFRTLGQAAPAKPA